MCFSTGHGLVTCGYTIHLGGIAEAEEQAAGTTSYQQVDLSDIDISECTT